MVLITQICRFFLLLSLVTFSEAIGNEKISGKYGHFLSWEYAKNSNDLESLKKYFKKIDIQKIDDVLLEEILFESVILDDWVKAESVSSILLNRDKNNFSANFFKTFNGLITNKNIDIYLENIGFEYLDINFLKAIRIWKSFDQKYITNEKPENCIPIVCLHMAISLTIRGDIIKAQEYYRNIEKEEFSSYRIKELLLLNSIESERDEAIEYVKQLNEHDLNLKNFDINYFKKNKYLLNPVENKTHGMAEVLYNISSWFYSKDLYKYSAFFGKLSLRLRPNFNAMKLLLSGAFDKLGYQKLGMKYIENANIDNLYYYKFLRIKLSLFEEQNMNKEFISSLENFLREYPDKMEMKILIADKFRKLEKYSKAIKIYSEIIGKEDNSKNWNVLYSRGISYERLNKWDKAERDLKEALKLNPDDAYILNYLAYSWLDRKKNIGQALSFLQKAVEIEPGDAYIIDSLGWAYYLSNKTEESIYFLEKAVSILPGDATLNDHLGDAYWKAGRKNEAVAQWKRVLLFDPNFKKKKTINRKISEGF